MYKSFTFGANPIQDGLTRLRKHHNVSFVDSELKSEDFNLYLIIV